MKCVKYFEISNSTPTELFFIVHERILQRGTQGRIFNLFWLTVTILHVATSVRNRQSGTIFDFSVNFHQGDIRVFCPFCFIGVANAIQTMRYSITYHLYDFKMIRVLGMKVIQPSSGVPKKRIVTKIPEASVSSSSWSSWSILDHKGQQCVNESQSRQG